MGNIKEDSLREALRAASCGVLPPPYAEGDGFWLRAIVLVRKRNGSESYAIAERDTSGTVRVKRDFGGGMSPMVTDGDGNVSPLSVHPYYMLDDSSVKGLDRQGRIKLLIRHYGVSMRSDFESMDDGRLEAEVRKMCLAIQSTHEVSDAVTDAIISTGLENMERASVTAEGISEIRRKSRARRSKARTR